MTYSPVGWEGSSAEGFTAYPRERGGEGGRRRGEREKRRREKYYLSVMGTTLKVISTL